MGDDLDDDDFFAKIARATIDVASPPKSKIVESKDSASRKRTRSSTTAALLNSDVKPSSNEVIIIDDDSDFIIPAKKATTDKSNDGKHKKTSPVTNLTLEEEMKLLEDEEKASRKKKKGGIFYVPPEENAVLHETKTLQKNLLDRIDRLRKGAVVSPKDATASSAADVYNVDEVEEVAAGSDDEIRHNKKEKAKKEKAEDSRSMKLTFRTENDVLPVVSVQAKYSMKLEKIFSKVKQAWTKSEKLSAASITAITFKANGEKIAPDMFVHSLAEDGIDEVQIDAHVPKK